MPATKAFGQPEFIRVTQVGSQIGQAPKARGTLRALGLHGIGTGNTLPMRPEIAGMLRKVRHLVRVDPVSATVETGQANGSDDVERNVVVEADGEAVFVSFPTTMRQNQADAEIHRLAAGDPDGTTLALRWDDGDGVLREYEASPPDRVWLAHGNSERFGLLRVDLKGLVVGLEPSLLKPEEPVDVYIHSTPDGLGRALTFVDDLGGRATVGVIVRSELEKLGVKVPNDA